MTASKINKHMIYNEAFYDSQAANSYRSACQTLPHLMRMVAPRSVADVGCGAGGWLEAFMNAGVQSILGIDGAWVPKGSLRIPAHCFHPMDLESIVPVAQSFDLAMSIEVAEHLTPVAGDKLVTLLTTLAPVVLFSAAVPGQGGGRHINEQWPGYWIDRFADNGYHCYDAIRPLIWFDYEIMPWLRQNMFIYVHKRAEEIGFLAVSYG